MTIETTLKNALYHRGYTSKVVKFDGRDYIEFKAPNGWTWLTRKSFYDYPFIPVTAFLVSKDKALGNSFAQHFSVPIPPSLHTRDITLGEAFLKEHAEVIVKPIASSGSRGLTLNITTTQQLKDAIETATIKGQAPLIQKQFRGEEVRLTLIDGQVQSAILRQTPRVVGDGVATIDELLQVENSTRRLLKFPTLTYPVIDKAIIKAENIDMNAVSALGEIVEFSHATMIRNGSSFIGVTHELHVSYKEVAQKLAMTLSPKMLVVDFLIEDYKEQATQKNYIFLEFNTTPGLQIYSSLRSGDQPDVISLLADAIDSEAHRSTI